MKNKKNCWGVAIGGSLLMATRFASGAPVWVSTAIPGVSFFMGSYDVTEGGEGNPLATYYHLGKTYTAEISEDRWVSEEIHDGPNYNTRADRKILQDKFGVTHVSFIEDNKAYHYFSPSGWELVSHPSHPVPEITLALDNSNILHAAYLLNKTDQFDVVYASRSPSGWNSETVRTILVSANYDIPHLSLDSGPDGTPILAYSGMRNEPVRVLIKRSSWTEIQSFPGNWGWPTLREDTSEHLHLVMSSTSPTPLVRYVFMDLSGTVGEDVSYPLPELATPGGAPPNTALSLDDQNRPHIVAGSVYLAPLASPLTLSSFLLPTSWTRIHLAGGKQPCLLGESPSLFLALTTLVDTPGSAQIVGRSTTSLTWNFTPAVGAARGYRLIRTSDGVDVSGLLSPSVNEFTQTGLMPNQPQMLITRAIFSGVTTNASSGTTHFTLAVPPTGVQVFRTLGNSVSLSWEPSGNVVRPIYRLILSSPNGRKIIQETTNESFQFDLIDPSTPYAITLSALNGDNSEVFVSSLSRVSQNETESKFSFEFQEDLGVDIALQGKGSGPALAVTVTPADSFPGAPSSFGSFTPSGLGFNVPTNQTVPLGQTVLLTLRYPEGRLNPTDTLILARFDSDRNQWIPLPSQSDGANRRLSATTRALGLFQAMVQTSPPTDVKNARVYPNPFRPSRHSVMAIQEVPSGTQVRIFSDGGRLVREFMTSDTNASWDGRDGDGNLLHSGVYVMRLEQNGGTKRVRFVLER